MAEAGAHAPAVGPVGAVVAAHVPDETERPLGGPGGQRGVDERGLHLFVTAKGAKSWRLRIYVNGVEQSPLTLGLYVVFVAGQIVRAGSLATLLGERVLEVILDAPPSEPPPGFRVTAAGLEAPLAGRTVESALALCRAHRLAVRASRVRVKSLEDIVCETHDATALGTG